MARPFWATLNRRNPKDPNGGSIADTVLAGAASTIRDGIDNFEGNLAMRVAESSRVIGLRRNKFSVFTNYAFDEGQLKNAFVGGAIRYQSGAVVGRAVNRDLIIGNSMTITDAFVGYRLRVAQRMVNLQINVNNLFEFDTPQITVTSPAGGIRRFMLVPLRTLRLSARIEF